MKEIFKTLKNSIIKYKYVILFIIAILIVTIFIVKREKYIRTKGQDANEQCSRYRPFATYIGPQMVGSIDNTFSKRDYTDNYMSRLVEGNPTVMINKNQDRDLLYHYGDQDKWIFTKEGFQNVPNVFVADDTNFRNWPYYYYSNPNPGGSFPPDMFSKLRQIEPGFEPNGLSYELRPGIKYRDFPSHRWIRNNSDYYYMNNL